MKPISGGAPGGFAGPAALLDHYARHGADFGATSAAHYEQMADAFLCGPCGTGVLQKARANGDIVRYDPATEAFGAVKPDGTIRTFFKPDPAVHGKATTWITSMHNSQTFTCPVCGYPGLPEPPYDAQGCASFEICPSCGTEFGYDDATRSHAELRQAWVAAGCPWRSQVIRPAPDWNAREQLQHAESKG